jgi:hypothetical protein
VGNGYARKTLRSLPRQTSLFAGNELEFIAYESYFAENESDFVETCPYLAVNKPDFVGFECQTV